MCTIIAGPHLRYFNEKDGKMRAKWIDGIYDKIAARSAITFFCVCILKYKLLAISKNNLSIRVNISDQKKKKRHKIWCIMQMFCRE